MLRAKKDFVIIDFEGEPALPLRERRIKQSPLRDVAGMVRSFHYAARAGLQAHMQGGCIEEDDLPKFQPWVRQWHQAVSSVYLRAYLKAMRSSEMLPKSEADLMILFTACLLNEAVYEIGCELNNRPAWLQFPLQGILEILAVTQL